MLGAAALPALGQLVSLLFVPESPKWLYSKGYRAQANKISDQLGLDEVLFNAQHEVCLNFDLRISDNYPNTVGVRRIDVMARVCLCLCG